MTQPTSSVDTKADRHLESFSNYWCSPIIDPLCCLQKLVVSWFFYLNIRLQYENLALLLPIKEFSLIRIADGEKPCEISNPKVKPRVGASITNQDMFYLQQLFFLILHSSSYINDKKINETNSWKSKKLPPLLIQFSISLMIYSSYDFYLFIIMTGDGCTTNNTTSTSTITTTTTLTLTTSTATTYCYYYNYYYYYNYIFSLNIR